MTPEEKALCQDFAGKGISSKEMKAFEQGLRNGKKLAEEELLTACKNLLKFNEGLLTELRVSIHYPPADYARRLIAKIEKV